MALLASCAPVALVDGGESRQLAEMLAWSQRVATSAPELQRRELSVAGRAFSRSAGTEQRLRLALLLAQPGSVVADDKRAATLLQPFSTAGNEAGTLNQFGGLLHAQVNERVREQRRAQQHREQFELEQKKAQQYREQIEALRDLEKNLRERNQTGGK